MKQILFKLNLNGFGVVNFDDSERQVYTLAKYKIATGLNKNVKLGKKVFFETNNGDGDAPKMDYKLKISADCLRHAIYEHNVDVVNPSIMQLDNVFANYLLSPVGMTRGYMFTYKDASSIKRKSPLTISDAIQSNGSKSNIEVGSTTGERSETSFFYTEKVGDINYTAKGIIDLRSLMFISADAKFDRLAINPDWITNGLAHDVLESHFGKDAKEQYGWFTSTAKYLTKALSENGILLNKEIVDTLVKFILKNLLAIDIRRNNAFAKTASLQIKFVDNPITDTFDEEDGWMTIGSEADIDSLDITPDEFYTKATDEDIKEIKDLEAKYEEIKKHASDKNNESKKDSSNRKRAKGRTKKTTADE